MTSFNITHTNAVEKKQLLVIISYLLISIHITTLYHLANRKWQVFPISASRSDVTHIWRVHRLQAIFQKECRLGLREAQGNCTSPPFFLERDDMLMNYVKWVVSKVNRPGLGNRLIRFWFDTFYFCPHVKKAEKKSTSIKPLQKDRIKLPFLKINKNLSGKKKVHFRFIFKQPAGYFSWILCLYNI